VGYSAGAPRNPRGIVGGSIDAGVCAHEDTIVKEVAAFAGGSVDAVIGSTKHPKYWDLTTVLCTGIFDRAIPWTCSCCVKARCPTI
jgi:hypothetical protein